jgi:single-strand DNA-binding protein
MSGSLNRVELIGNLGRDPESPRLNNGNMVVNFSIATSETWKDKDSGEKKERTDWHNIVIFNDALCRVAEQYLKKGSKIYISGKLQTRKWQDQSGQDRYSTEVVLQAFGGELVMLGDPRGVSADERYGSHITREGSGSVQSGGEFGRSSPMERRPAGGGGSRYNDLDDHIPFAPEWRG